MKRLLVLLALFLPVSSHAQTDVLRMALDTMGVSPDSVGFRPSLISNLANPSDPFRLPYMDDLLAEPLKLASFSTTMVNRYAPYVLPDSSHMGGYRRTQIRLPAALIQMSAKNLGLDMGKYGWDYSPRLSDREPLVEAVREIYLARNQPLGSVTPYDLPTFSWSNFEGRIRDQVGKLPPAARKPVARIVAVLNEAIALRDDAIRNIPREDLEHIYFSTTLEESQCDAHTFDKTVYDAALAFDRNSMIFGAMKLAQVVQKAIDTLRALGLEQSFRADIPTPAGRILLSNGDDDVHYPQDCLLLIDFSGDDTYLGSVGSSSPSLPVSVCIDFGGDDRYRNDHERLYTQGAGILGIGMLFDLDGDDTYESVEFSQGCGRFGVGLLLDYDGDDVYTSRSFSQGAGLYGIGILHDGAGNDLYRSVYYGQGYGFSLGLGLLSDREGNDRYIADDTELNHVGDETPKHNESDAQGFGGGRRADHTDGYNMSGGLGILSDLDGNDEYFAGVFAQASGYWYGYGILHDARGDDRYRGVFFNLAGTAHFSLAALLEGGGNDVTDLVMTCGLGMAHDGSASVYLDAGGDDTYTMTDADSRSCGLGASLNSSFSLFANIGGNDTYKPVGTCVAYATSRRRGAWSVGMPTTAIFIDIGGEDTYEYKQGRNNSVWLQPPDPETTNIRAVGIDISRGGITFPR